MDLCFAIRNDSACGSRVDEQCMHCIHCMDNSLNRKIREGANEQRAEGSDGREPSPASIDRAPSSDSQAQVSGQHCAQGEHTGEQAKMGQVTPIPSPHHSPRKRNKIRASKEKATRSLCTSLVHFVLTFNNCRRGNGLVSLH